MKVLIMIPAFNEEANIISFVEECKAILPDYDFVVINDCSTDSTLSLLREHKHPVLNLHVNLGIGGAVQTGYLYARDNNYDIAVQMDGDGQHNPKDLFNLLEPLRNGEADLVVGSRFISGQGFQSSAIRRLGISILRAAIQLRTGCVVTDPTSGFRAANRRMIELFSMDYAQDYPEPESLIVALKSGAKVRDVPVNMRERMGGVSSISELRAIYYMCKVTLAVLLHTPRK